MYFLFVSFWLKFSKLFCFLGSFENSSASSPHLDPFEAAPFNPAQLKRYFERQQSSEASAAVSSSTSNSTSTSDPSTTSGAKSKPYLVHVGSTGASSVPTSSATKSSTVITIRSNNDFVISQSNGGAPSAVNSNPALLAAPVSSAQSENSSSSQGICPLPLPPPPPPSALPSNLAAFPSLKPSRGTSSSFTSTHSRNNSLPSNWQTFT